MQRQDVISIIITFVVGFLGGGYLYVAHFAKLVNPDTTESQESFMEFTVMGEAYGSCGTDCPAFQVQKDGSYRYKFSPNRGESVIRDGVLPLSQQRTLKKSLDEDALALQSESIPLTTCNSTSGGIDIKYRITYKGTEYLVDSCGTAVDSSGELWAALGGVWQYLQTVE